jgi:ParB family chromosome partitioning protein
MSQARKVTLTIDDPLAPAPAAIEARNTDQGIVSAHPVSVSIHNDRRRTETVDKIALAGQLRTVPIDAVVPNQMQPRVHFEDEALQALVDSIRERGILQPPIVRETASGRFELVAGERRWRAARLAGHLQLDVLVRNSDDIETLQDALTENILRQDLSPVEEARAYATLIEDIGITREELGRRVGRSRVSISNHLRLLDLPDDVLELLNTGALTFAHGRALLLCDEHATRRELAHRAVAEGWSKRQLEAAARRAGAPRARTPTQPERIGVDQQALAHQLGDAVSRATGADIHVRAAAGDTYTFTVRGHENVRKLASKLDGHDLDPL